MGSFGIKEVIGNGLCNSEQSVLIMYASVGTGNGPDVFFLLFSPSLTLGYPPPSLSSSPSNASCSHAHPHTQPLSTAGPSIGPDACPGTSEAFIQEKGGGMKMSNNLLCAPSLHLVVLLSPAPHPFSALCSCVTWSNHSTCLGFSFFPPNWARLPTY